MILNELAKDNTLKYGKADKRLAAATGPQYREVILAKMLWG